MSSGKIEQNSMLLVLPGKISSNTCRSCFVECDTQISLTKHKFDNTLLKDLYALYCGITVQDDDSFPKNICNKCTTAILDFHIFRRKCIFSEEVWKSFKDKQDDYKKPENSEDNELYTDTIEIKEEILIKYEDNLIENDSAKENNLCSEENEINDQIKKCKKQNPIVVACIKSNAISQQNKVKKSYICKFCDKNCKNKFRLVHHERTHTGEKPYICSQCGHSFAVSSEMKRHTLTHTDIKPFSCKTCERSFRRRYHLHVHENNVHGNGRRATNNDSVRKSIRNINRPGSFLCSICGKTLSNRGSLILHTRRHVGENPYHCTECDKKFVESSILKQHIAKCHYKGKYMCDYCGKKFAIEYYLKKHLMIHTGEKPHKCSVCGKCFSESGSLKKHSIIHTDKKPYACRICFKTFKDCSTCKRHELIHSVSLHKCPLCRRVYRDPLVMERHKLTHKTSKNGKSKRTLNSKTSIKSE